MAVKRQGYCLHSQSDTLLLFYQWRVLQVMQRYHNLLTTALQGRQMRDALILQSGKCTGDKWYYTLCVTTMGPYWDALPLKSIPTGLTQTPSTTGSLVIRFMEQLIQDVLFYHNVIQPANTTGVNAPQLYDHTKQWRGCSLQRLAWSSSTSAPSRNPSSGPAPLV